MEEIPYWIQRSDFSSTDFPAVDAESAIGILQSHDWQAELEFERARNESGLESCPPGIGLVAGDGRVLHLCPWANGSALVQYTSNEPRSRWPPAPALIRFGVVIVAGAASWRFLTAPDSAAALVPGWAAAAIGVYALRGLVGDLRQPLTTVSAEAVGRTARDVPAREVPKFVRRFFANDHEWLCAHMQPD